MGLEKEDLQKIAEFRSKHSEGNAMAMLGDCHFHFDNAYLQEICRQISDINLQAPASLPSFAKALNFSIVESFDVYGRPTVKWDLHEPIPEAYRNKFDWVVDAGTTFCCFDVSAVFKNICLMLKNNGCVLHISGLTGYFGRGYYSLHPSLFHDFYTANGFEVLYMGVRCKPSRKVKSGFLGSIMDRLMPVEYPNWESIGKDCFLNEADRDHMKFHSQYSSAEPDMVPNNAVIMCFARRKQVQEFKRAIPESYK